MLEANPKYVFRLLGFQPYVQKRVGLLGSLAVNCMTVFLSTRADTSTQKASSSIWERSRNTKRAVACDRIAGEMAFHFCVEMSVLILA